MKIVFGNVLRAEHGAKGTGGALDQSTPARKDAVICPISHQTSLKTVIFQPNWPERAWPARLTASMLTPVYSRLMLLYQDNILLCGLLFVSNIVLELNHMSSEYEAVVKW